MTADARTMWEILVPTVRRSDGRPYRTRYHRVWDSKVREISGGLTIMPPARGQWVSPGGELMAERMIPVRLLATRKEMDLVVDMTLVYYDQLAVLAYCVGADVILKHKEN